MDVFVHIMFILVELLQGTKYIYESFLKPFISKHEPEIDRTLSEFKTRAGDSASLYFQRVLSYAQTRSFDLLQLVMAQSIQRPPPQVYISFLFDNRVLNLDYLYIYV